MEAPILVDVIPDMVESASVVDAGTLGDSQAIDQSRLVYYIGFSIF